ncbi:DUF1566 domain-containing protein [Granulicella cerasi]|uniref:DUF1566 domain-containing protein n=1 Tax=Granulicella cerasi TaxID=741063 RepID=A0ABW1ZB07_9BACT
MRAGFKERKWPYFSASLTLFKRLHMRSRLQLAVVIALVLPHVSSLAAQNDVVWYDSATRLTWMRRDNGKDVNWREAERFCRNSRESNHSGWRLPTIGELRTLYDYNAISIGRIPKSRWHPQKPMMFHVRGNLFLTGNIWSGTKVDDFAFFFDFINGYERKDDASFYSGANAKSDRRAICVSDATKTE